MRNLFDSVPGARLALTACFLLFVRAVGSADDHGHAAAGPKTTNRSFVIEWGSASTGTIDHDVFKLALGASACAVRSGAVEAPPTLTIIDYSRPSSEKRLWVFDLRLRELLHEELVAHGQGSGEQTASRFSNEPETHMSSLGLFVTEDTYVGKNGYSLRLRGLDRGFNDRAHERAIVMHGASYVSAEFVRTFGRLGRSWGCPALRQETAREVIDRVKGGSLLFVYYPDQNWLRSSRFLGHCSSD
jgi:L,D-transpeptidase-like protein